MNSLMLTNNNAQSFIGNYLNDFFGSNSSKVNNLPAVNVVELNDGFRIEVAAPGLKKEDFKLNLHHNNLTISATQGTSKEESGKNPGFYARKEFSYSSFQRTFTLPASVEVDKIQASYTDGILKIEVPKRAEAKVKPARQIEIAG